MDERAFYRESEAKKPVTLNCPFRSVVPPPTAHIPWSSLFKYRSIWGLMIGMFCLNFAIYFFLTWFPVTDSVPIAAPSVEIRGCPA